MSRCVRTDRGRGRGLIVVRTARARAHCSRTHVVSVLSERVRSIHRSRAAAARRHVPTRRPEHLSPKSLRSCRACVSHSQCSQMLGIFPIPGISIQSLGQNFDHWEIPKTHKSLGILISGTKIRISPLKSSKNAQFRLKYHPCLKIWQVEIS